MNAINVRRRAFLASTAGGLGLSSVLGALQPLAADETKLAGGVAPLSDEIEPLVQFLERTPRDSIIGETARRVRNGLSYRRLLAALLLAGVRNVQPRPSVGFKFHAVLVVNSAHLASLSGTDEERWLPIFWAIDNFKQSQQRDIEEGNWTLPPVEVRAVPDAGAAIEALTGALDRWDEPAADAAITAVVRNFGSAAVFDLLAPYAARDFRSIGHKVIYLSNAFRTLQTVGWDYAEPVMRSLVYAMLNHNGEPNPSQSDLAPDRPGRQNLLRAEKRQGPLVIGKPDTGATGELLRALHTATADEAGEQVTAMLDDGVSVASLWDAVFSGAAELLLRQRGIVSLHAVTTTNAIRQAFSAASSDQTRRYLLMQNASFLTMFRDAAQSRGELSDDRIDEMKPIEPENGRAEIANVFATMGQSRKKSAQEMLGALQSGTEPREVVDHARRLVFLKGNDSHDYKFSSAALEDYRVISAPWRNRFLAASMQQLCSPNEKTRPLVKQIEQALVRG